MRKMTPIEKNIYNHGERLIFGVSHDQDEDIRHRSSYVFFRQIIENDIAAITRISNKKPISIIDLGCGVGHGCQTLSEIKNSLIVGVDSCEDTIEYARGKYSGENIIYKCADLEVFIPEMCAYDYVVSRGVFEHIPKGLELVFLTKWNKRLLFDVPYNELNANHYHVLNGIKEEDFLDKDVELFYQDMKGIIYNSANKPKNPNMIICVQNNPALPKVKDMDIIFPVPAWNPTTN